MDGWMHACMNGWMDVWMDAYMYVDRILEQQTWIKWIIVSMQIMQPQNWGSLILNHIHLGVLLLRTKTKLSHFYLRRRSWGRVNTCRSIFGRMNLTTAVKTAI